MDLFPTLPTVIFHVVFSTREQAPLITPEIRMLLYSYIDGLIMNADGLVIECDGTADHIHLLTSFSHDRSVESMIVQIKSDSAAWVNKKLKPKVPFAWQESYFAVTVSQSSAYEDREYIRSQAEIHRNKSFKEEFIELLEKNHVEYDKDDTLWE